MSTVAQLPASARLQSGPSNAYQGSQDTSNLEETFTWKVPWADSSAFYQVVVGSLATISYGSGLSIQRRIPLQHPYNPSLWATKLGWRGIDSPRKPAGAPVAWIVATVTFAYPGYSMGADNGGGGGSPNGYPPFAKVTSQATPRLITDVSRQYKYTPPGGTIATLNQNVAKQFGGNTFQVTLYAIPNLDTWQAVVAPLTGKVNSQPFQIGAFTRAAGTVLLEGYGFEADQDLRGNTRWTGTLNLNCSSLPWNSVFVAGKVCPLTPAPYDTGDLNTLYM